VELVENFWKRGKGRTCPRKGRIFGVPHSLIELMKEKRRSNGSGSYIHEPTKPSRYNRHPPKSYKYADMVIESFSASIRGSWILIHQISDITRKFLVCSQESQEAAHISQKPLKYSVMFLITTEKAATAPLATCKTEAQFKTPPFITKRCSGMMHRRTNTPQ
jgi:hypothetical protein